ncbi:hypothetical protein EUX98_g7991 [Antrodiella citrinella]|uniref:UDP-glycosyltransferases domain-containing protein n=1 Tax=Antrodiella citrinella TaxID=2447956 RepID=A0A4V3XGY7_9APHY|nr:hypothetical protein EUX98_g7991 [Antrodiella citrinella]
MSSTASINIPHLVVAGAEPWGHARPLCAFVARVVLNRPVYVTLFTTPRVCARVKTEISRWFGPEDAERHNLIRVVALDCLAEGASNFIEALELEHQRYVAAFEDAYKLIMAARPVTCFETKVEVLAVPAPKVVVIDFMAGRLTHTIHKISNAKAIAFACGMATFGYTFFAPSERSGRPNFKVKVLEEAARTGRDPLEIADDLGHTYTDDIIQNPGLPKMYHWENDPQQVGHMLKGILGGIWMGFADAYDSCDGMLITSPEVYEPHAIAATKEWFAESSRSVWAIGPLAPATTTEQAMSNEEAQSENSADIKKFLDSVLSKNGEHSAIYVSFGSGFWPSELSKLETFVDVLLEKKVPFILSYGSPLAQLTDSFKERVGQSGLGLLSRWSPQQTILSHQALGWFVTHAGHNSILEALQSGVPMICWPFHADQPANAVCLTEVHDVAYELLEVRTGNGLKPILRTGKAPVNTSEALRAEVNEVLDKAFGDDGAQKRVNVKKLQQKINSAWDKDGPAYVDMVRFLDTL